MLVSHSLQEININLIIIPEWLGKNELNYYAVINFVNSWQKALPIFLIWQDIGANLTQITEEYLVIWIRLRVENVTREPLIAESSKVDVDCKVLKNR